MPEGSENVPAGTGPGGSNDTNMSIASPSRVLPRVEVGDILNSWEEFADWKQLTSRLLWFYVGMSPEGVVLLENEVQSPMILSARLSRPMMKEGRAFDNSYPALWKWLNERYEKLSATLISANYSNLVAMKMTASESVEDYISRADGCMAVLEVAPQKIEMVFVIQRGRGHQGRGSGRGGNSRGYSGRGGSATGPTDDRNWAAVLHLHPVRPE